MKNTHTLGDLQLAIMRVVWRRGEATVAQVHRELFEERGLAPTTIATMLVKLEKKGVLTHRLDGRRYVYRSTIDEAEIQRSMVGELTDRLFDGNVAALVSHLLSEHEADPAELAELERLIAAREREDR